MTDTCIPLNPSVSGWWWIRDERGMNGDTWPVWWQAGADSWDLEDETMSPVEAYAAGYRILCPVPSHSEVEALREHNTELQEQLRHAMSNADNTRGQLTAANAEIARLRAGIKDAMGWKQAEDWHGKLHRLINPEDVIT